MECVLKSMGSIPGSNITTLIDEAGGVDKVPCRFIGRFTFHKVVVSNVAGESAGA